MYIFEFDPRNSFDYIKVFNEAMQMTAYFYVNFLLYFKTRRGDLPQYFNWNIYPLALFMFFLIKLFFPLSQRMAFLTTMKNLIISPFCTVRFVEFYAGDICTSLVKVFVDVAFSFCYFGSGEYLQSPNSTAETSFCKNNNYFKKVVSPSLLALPLWWRVLQCLRRYTETRNRFPHLANAIKYAVALCLVLFGAFHPEVSTLNNGVDFYQMVYIFTFFISTLYTFSWDVFMDWGLGKSMSNFGLRHTLMFNTRFSKWLYLGAIGKGRRLSFKEGVFCFF